MKYDNPLDERDLLEREHAGRMEDLEQQHYDAERDMRILRADELDPIDADALRDDPAGFCRKGLGL